MSPRVGVLALQGAFEPHVRILGRLGFAAHEVRAPADLEGLTHLVLPGGESTTLARLLALFDLERPLVERHAAGELHLMGTCAGAILLARDCGGRPATLGCLDAAVRRNAYGTQVDSFVRPLTLEGDPDPLPGVFIRAPRFEALGDGVRALVRDGGEVVAVEAPGVLATTFHPELTGDARLHARFLGVAQARNGRSTPRSRAQSSASG
jgi:5'-phosphate synthase pdxT subunit